MDLAWLTINWCKNLDKENYDYFIFADLLKTFDTVEYNILLVQLEHYSIHGIANEWLNPTSLTENNWFPLIVMFLIKSL